MPQPTNSQVACSRCPQHNSPFQCPVHSLPPLLPGLPLPPSPQAWFANALARPVRTASAIKELTAIKAAYDSCSGLPPTSLFNAFNQHARSVMQCGSWMQVLAALRLGFSASACAGSSPRALFAAILRQAVVDSFRAGYHRTPTLSLKMAQSEGFLNWLEVKPLGTTTDKWI